MDDDQGRKKMLDEIWLTYFNDYLFKRGAITAEQRRKMAREIARLCS